MSMQLRVLQRMSLCFDSGKGQRVADEATAGPEHLFGWTDCRIWTTILGRVSNPSIRDTYISRITGTGLKYSRFVPSANYNISCAGRQPTVNYNGTLAQIGHTPIRR